MYILKKEGANYYIAAAPRVGRKEGCLLAEYPIDAKKFDTAEIAQTWLRGVRNDLCQRGFRSYQLPYACAVTC